jgi:hypothetical protein
MTNKNSYNITTTTVARNINTVARSIKTIARTTKIVEHFITVISINGFY